ncbi:MAG: alternative ribosome rescue aminoacyl-tRNA hydrolase ArfB [Desulfomonilia bacterium]
MIRISSDIIIEEDELSWEFVRSGGPGGQNVNKVATAVQLRFDVAGSASLPPDVKDRLKRIAGRRMTAEGVLIIRAQRFRSQERNRVDARERLQEIITEAVRKPRPRIRTRPSSSSRIQRLESKRRMAAKKGMRHNVIREDS